MTFEQAFLLGLLAAIFALFVWGKWRYDVVAFLALLAATVAGMVPPAEAFLGFGHPATVTVACVLILSRALVNSGAVDLVARTLMPPVKSPSQHVGMLAGIAGALSAVMNNVGALALLMPVALQSAAKVKRAPAVILMPLSFGSILGGLVTLIGTPPNIIIATFRAEIAGAPFSMFDFTPVGGAIAIGGILFVATIGWRLIPKTRRAKLSAHDLFEIEDYISEAQVPKDSKAIGQTLAELGDAAEAHDAVILELIRDKSALATGRRREKVRAGDVLTIESPPDALDKVLATLDLKRVGGAQDRARFLGGDDVIMMEAVVATSSTMAGRTPEALRLQGRRNVNLLAVSRQGRPFRGRLKTFRFRPGDILLLQGDAERVAELMIRFGCLPLAERRLQTGNPQLAVISIGVFAAAVVGASLGLLSLPVALALAAVVMVVLNIVPPRDIYDSVDWPVVVLLGAMIPIGAALNATGTTGLIATALVDVTAGSGPVVLLVLLIVVTMTLSDILNNAATAVVMAPIAMGMAQQLGVNPDCFLMAVAVGASCAFLTPIGHQNNTLILGPGGYHFGDYWRMGLPLEILILLIGVPMLLWIWPL
ncbi:MAG: SLC13 family permease [Alphaproteobacteria bacterium]